MKSGNLERIGYLGDLGIDGRIKLKGISSNMVLRDGLG
jgi:hypothetical protein